MKNSPFIRFVDVHKIYPNGVKAVTDFNLDINEREFIVLVGPSGCGKSTTLRMLAGLENITQGTLFINGEIANNLTPKERDLAMVFQSYALYPHMSVYNNLAFGLKMRHHEEEVRDDDGNIVLAIATRKLNELQRILTILNKRRARVVKTITKIETKANGATEASTKLSAFLSDLDKIIHSYTAQKIYYETTPLPVLKKRKYTKEEIDAKVQEAAAILDIKQYLHAKPRELSGGQRQRVALGRSIVRNANLFLMDEPLSNLDAKLRILMRSEIVALHRRLKSTTIYVTHDQTEAMTMADRIVIMKDGFIQQVGTPQAIYEKPTNLFTATFIGSPEMNIFPVTIDKKAIIFNNNEEITDQRVFATYQTFIKAKVVAHDNETKHTYEDYVHAKTLPLYFGIRPEDIEITKTKSTDSITGTITNIELLGKEYYVHLLVNNKTIVAIVSNRNTLNINDTVYLTFPSDKRYFFDVISEENIYAV